MATHVQADAKPEAKVEAARGQGAAGFPAAGIPLADFQEVPHSISRWAEWCQAWCERAAVHEEIGREALAAGHRLSAGPHLTTAAVCYHFAKFMFAEQRKQLRAAPTKAVKCRTQALPHRQPPGERIE